MYIPGLCWNKRKCRNSNHMRDPSKTRYLDTSILDDMGMLMPSHCRTTPIPPGW